MRVRWRVLLCVGVVGDGLDRIFFWSFFGEGFGVNVDRFECFYGFFNESIQAAILVWGFLIGKCEICGKFVGFGFLPGL